MLAVQTKRTLRGVVGCRAVEAHVAGSGLAGSTTEGVARQARPPRVADVRQVEVARVAQRDEDVVEGVLDGAPGGVHPHRRVLRLLVGRGDAGELRDLAAPRLGVEALAVAALALLERGGDVHEEERAAGLLDHRPHLLPGLVERRDRAAHGDAAVPGDLGGDPADPADVGLAVLLGERQAGRQVAAYDVAVEAGHGAAAALQQPVHQGSRQRRLAAAGEAGEEQHESLLVGRGPVRRHDRGASSSGSSPPSTSPWTGSPSA